jgi:hypothetical protein
VTTFVWGAFTALTRKGPHLRRFLAPRSRAAPRKNENPGDNKVNDLNDDIPSTTTLILIPVRFASTEEECTLSQVADANEQYIALSGGEVGMDFAIRCATQYIAGHAGTEERWT